MDAERAGCHSLSHLLGAPPNKPSRWKVLAYQNSIASDFQVSGKTRLLCMGRNISDCFVFRLGKNKTASTVYITCLNDDAV